MIQAASDSLSFFMKPDQALLGIEITRQERQGAGEMLLPNCPGRFPYFAQQFGASSDLIKAPLEPAYTREQSCYSKCVFLRF